MNKMYPFNTDLIPVDELEGKEIKEFAIEVITSDGYDLVVYIKGNGETPADLMDIQQTFGLFYMNELIPYLKGKTYFLDIDYAPLWASVH